MPRLRLLVLCGCVLLVLAFFHFRPAHLEEIQLVTVTSGVFTDLYTRIRLGGPYVWLNGERKAVESEVLHPIADKTFYMLKTGAEVMWERLPVHLDTTLKRFPHHQIYADAEALIGGESVIDILDTLPESLLSDIQFQHYRNLKTQYQDAYGWLYSDVKKTELGAGWNTDKFKNVPMALHAYRNAPKNCDWFVFADDDTFIHSNSLGELLKGLNPRKKHYIGSPAAIKGGIPENTKTGRRRKSKLGSETYLDLVFAHGGSAAIVSRAVLDELFWDPQREDDTVNKYSEIAIHLCCGDAVFGFMLMEELEVDVNDSLNPDVMLIDPFWGENTDLTYVSVKADGWCKPIISWHHLEPHEIQQFFDWERALSERKPNARTPVLFSDIYIDFILPFIRPEMEYWKIAAFSHEFANSSQVLKLESGLITPNDSEKECRRSCELREECLGWMFEYRKDATNVCAHEDAIVNRGVNLHPFKGTRDSEVKVVSGWIIDRIRERRARETCDWLEFDPETKLYNDWPNQQEGWYFRDLLVEQHGKTDVPVYEI